MIPTLAGGGVILGGWIDYGTGAVYNLQPNPLTITLACTEVAKTSPAKEEIETAQTKPLLVKDIEVTK